MHRFDIRQPASAFEVLTMLDLAPLRFEDEGAVSRKAILASQKAAGVFFCSEFAATEVQSYVGSLRHWIAYPGVRPLFFHPSALSVAQRLRLGIPGPFIMVAGGASDRKNLRSLAAAWKSAAEVLGELTLLLVGPGADRKRDLFAGLPGVRIYEPVPDRLLASLMASAEVLVIPSCYEGFGMPAIEAMAAGTPVVAANRGALPEVVGNAGLLVEPDPDSLAAGLSKLILDRQQMVQLQTAGKRRARHFTWDEAAKVHIAAYEEALATR